MLASRVGVSLPTIRAAERGEGGAGVFLRMTEGLSLEVTGRSLPPGETLGARLRALRTRLRISQREAAARAGCSATTVAAIERGALGHLAAFEALADALGARLTLVELGRAPGFYNGPATSAAWDAWATPSDLLDRLYPLVGGAFQLDPCSPGRSRSRVRARVHYTADDDGLTLPWGGTVFMNPPYSRALPRWTAKARQEVAAGRAEAVFGLLPARTDTAWWHRNVAGSAHVLLLRGRLRFGDGRQAAPFPSALVLWGGLPVLTGQLTEAFPDSQPLLRQQVSAIS